ncbi:exported hypothetical protein [Vibrio nigripulchritudo SOn1]|uniref:Uncharacterized protein n=1 Tax=Vibrio nigripulchritudo SOn1 TaxID=1238450 RepID=A0AAV2VZ85_9VIBR|nr:hypothetical protein [Vibrio nigripulchritudo]CCO50084.1 exported hypothetical protein [Vibrio nigripulchritudo SOn1]
MKKLFVLLSALFSFALSAGQVTQTGLKVTKVMAGYPNGEVYFYVDKLPKNPKNCANPRSNHNILVVDPKRSDVSQVLSVLLTSKASHSNIEIQVYDDYCLNDYAVIRRVAVY